MPIQHLVISGGGPSGIKSLGILQHLEQQEYWKIENIKSIYGTSVGSAIAVLLAMKFDWKTIEDYIVQRPWHEALHIEVNQLYEAFSKRGLFDKELMMLFFKPLFFAKDVSLDITLLDFYEYSKIEIHMFSLELNHFELIDISYKTHPTLGLMTAIQMSSAIPFIISPVCMDEKCYIDGGILCNYAINECIASGATSDTILGLKNKYINKVSSPIVDENSSLLEYIMTCINKIVDKVSAKSLQEIPHEVINQTTSMTFENIKDTIMKQDIRQTLFDEGIATARDFIIEQNSKIVLDLPLLV